MRRAQRQQQSVDQSVDQRIRRLLAMTETFAAKFGAELASAQSEMDPDEFARFVERLGVGRSKVDRFMQAARLANVPVSELRPPAWALLFGKLEPIPVLPGETDPLIAEVAVAAEPPKYRRRADLLSADGLAWMLVAMHRPTALSMDAAMALVDWFHDKSDPDEALAVLRSWRSDASECRQDDPATGMREGISTAQEAQDR